MMRTNKTVRTALSGVLLLTVVATGVMVYRNGNSRGQEEEQAKGTEQVQEEIQDVSTGNAQAEHIQESENPVHPLMDEFQIQEGLENPYISEKESEGEPDSREEEKCGETQEMEAATPEEHNTETAQGNTEKDSVEETQEETAEAEKQQDATKVHGGQTESDGSTEEKAKKKETEDAAAAARDSLNFSEESNIVWPASGQVVIDYDMDGTVYFPTLDQYKYHEGMVVGTKVGEPVQAVFHGKVSGIREDARTGKTLTMDMGNGYEAVYGQLKDIEVKQGQTVEKGTILGKVEEPTKYYVKEGANLYFAMKKDGNYVDPMLYIKNETE